MDLYEWKKIGNARGSLFFSPLFQILLFFIISRKRGPRKLLIDSNLLSFRLLAIGRGKMGKNGESERGVREFFAIRNRTHLHAEICAGAAKNKRKEKRRSIHGKEKKERKKNERDLYLLKSSRPSTHTNFFPAFWVKNIFFSLTSPSFVKNSLFWIFFPQLF